MRNVAICGSGVRRLLPGNRSLADLQIEGVGLTCGLIVTRGPAFDPRAPENRRKVLLKVRGFSCNFRDLNFILATARKGSAESFFVVGSDLVGEIVEVGSQVTRFVAGDRVISDNHYTGSGVGRVPEGVLTNNASKEFQIVHEDKLARIPDELPDEVAAAFSIGAQTTYSMIRKLAPRPGSTILVTAAKSNTSLFAINALRQHDVRVYATSTSRRHEEELRGLGVRELIVLDSQPASLIEHERVRRIVSEVGLFDYVFDPYFDLHLPMVVDVIAPQGKYITCGLRAQFQPGGGAAAEPRAAELKGVLVPVMVKNLQLIGNCIGLTEDLEAALRDYAAGSLRVSLDSVYGGDEVGAFFERTYNSADRFGKVVYLYN